VKNFFGEDLFLFTQSAKKIYDEVKELPIIDYHCHLDQNKIARDEGFLDIGELWLSSDHYKWRAMRLCGVDEKYITGDAPFKEKFIKYAEILPKLVGNPLYYWSHMELVQIFGITEELNGESAERIYGKANEILKTVKISTLLKKFKVEYVATTDDPTDDLAYHGELYGTKIMPTFRPDKLYSLSSEYLQKLGTVAGVEIKTFSDCLNAVEKRLDYFVSKGCKISDHGFYHFPKRYANKEECEELFLKRENLTPEEKDGLFGYLLVWLAKEYAKRGMLMQIHFAVLRNCNGEMFKRCGVDAGFDLIGDEQNVEDVINFFNQIGDSERPDTVIYPLNDCNLRALSSITGAFRNIKIGAAWWFNDTVEGIRRNLKTVAEYSALGTSYGMLTDSRSFSSYVRFDFYRRILSDYLGSMVESGEYSLTSAISVAKDICYNNIRNKIYG